MKAHNTIKLFSVILTGMFISACQTVSNENVNVEEIVSYQLHYEHYSSQGEKLEGFGKKQDITLYFPVVNGAIFGGVTNNYLQKITVPQNEKFSLNLSTDYSSIAKRFQQKDLSIVPENTQVMRLGTFHAYPSYGNRVGGGGFLDTSKQEALILVYFSQPSNLTGVTSSSGGIYEFDIHAKSKGWVWLKIHEHEKNKFKVTPYQGSVNTIEFKAILRNITST